MTVIRYYINDCYLNGNRKMKNGNNSYCLSAFNGKKSTGIYEVWYK